MGPHRDRPATDHTRLGAPVDARPHFAREHTALLAGLRSLAPADWRREAVPGWTVRDLAAHLLGDYYGRLGRDRDAHREGPSFAPGETLETFLHRANQEWVDACARISPAALVDTLELIGAQVTRFFATADPGAPSLGVSWAGADPAPMWLDCAREFTEFWTHRQQIRRATGDGTDPDPVAASLVVDTFMRALPHTLRDVDASGGTRIRVVVTGPGAGTWTATRVPATGTPTETASAAPGHHWSLAHPEPGPAEATVRFDTETAWLLCTRGIEPAEALPLAGVEGDHRLAVAACRIVSVVH
ncbi:maleylpyruvate isomerase family mycothiol-dependent enzyme [Streptomyces sp. NPDC006798]|uniref:maleylpyruvate isomerase family mycothiol-dependent enzyme n=1 Tax=Streptomyces sp. NPDC006798 TaxID=3155462 RepID=UPI0033D076EF